MKNGQSTRVLSSADLVSAAGDYKSPNKFSGSIKNVVVTLDGK